MSRLTHRELIGELMDDPALPAAMHGQALRGLGRINVLSRTARQLGWAVERVTAAKASAQQPLRILDVACGRGDVTIGLSRYAKRRGLAWRVDGCDLSERAVALADALARRTRADCRFFAADALAGLPGGYDAVVSSLFLHHLDDDAIARLLGHAGQARHVVISDLRRGRLAYAITWLGCRLLSRSAVVHADGPRSVRAALTADELHHLAQRAGLAGARVGRVWPQRLLLTWSRA